MSSRTLVRVWPVVCSGFVAGVLLAPAFWDRAQAQQGDRGNPNERIADLEETVALLADSLIAVEAKLASLSVDGDDVIFEGVNLVVRNGVGSTNTTNGLGNLIVGYDADDGDDKTGSHNLVVGDGHSYPAFGGLVAGFDNTISAGYSSVSGGFGNEASGYASSVSGGNTNEASHDASSVGGGELNLATGIGASVSGGFANEASELYASVSGGTGNEASGVASSVSGGNANQASGFFASVSGGLLNVASQFFATVSGGSQNVAAGSGSTVSGGAMIITDIGSDHQP